MIVRPEAPADVAAVHEVVRVADTGVRRALVYPDVFWQHDAVGLRP